MRARAAIGEDSVPRLPRHVKLRFDATRGQWLMLAPERVFVPNEIAVEILRLCDGATTVAAIADRLSARFEAPRETVGRDVLEMLQDLADKGVVVA